MIKKREKTMFNSYKLQVNILSFNCKIGKYNRCLIDYAGQNLYKLLQY